MFVDVPLNEIGGLNGGAASGCDQELWECYAKHIL